MQPEHNNPHRYDDILRLQRPVSKYPKMSDINRAAQFAPFAALTGYEDAITETRRLTQEKPDLDENAKAILDQKLQMILVQKERHPLVKITYFVPDEKKNGGSYAVVQGTIKEINGITHSIVMDDGTIIQMDDIFDFD